jgi:hypothetical protein
MARVSTKQIVAMSTKEFKVHLREQDANLSFNTLTRYRKALMAGSKPVAADIEIIAENAAEGSSNDGADGAVAEGASGATSASGIDQGKKARAVYAMLRARVDVGVPLKRRKAGTGSKRELQVEYKDTPANRKAGRVGTTYAKVVYEDAETEDVTRKLRRHKRASDPSKKRTGNAWIQAVASAKKEMNAPAFLIIRKQSDDPTDIGVSVYKRAKEIMAEAKVQAPVAATDTVVSTTTVV